MTTRLAELTTMRVGGPAERVLTAHTKDELVQHALELWGSADPWLLLGGGSNTVVCDEGYPGTVLLVRNAGVDRVVEGDADGHVRLRVQAGQDWDALVAFCVEQGWSGIEALSGIPGLAGAAPIQNIGAYGAELGDVLHSIEFLDAESGEVVRLAAAELELGYRDSAIKRGREGVVLSIDLVLQTSDSGLSAPIAYAQLANALGVELGGACHSARFARLCSRFGRRRAWCSTPKITTRGAQGRSSRTPSCLSSSPEPCQTMRRAF